MEFKGVCNGSLEKAECATFKPTSAKTISIPVNKNGAIITGDGYDEGFLVGVDFDVRTKMSEKELPAFCHDTMVVRSGGGGYHCYFLTDNKIANQMNDNPRAKYLKGIDVRGTNGKMFAPGTKFKEHKYPYILLDEDYATGKKNPKFIKSEVLLKKIKELLIPDITLRKAFQMLLNGQIQIEHQKSSQTNEPEFKYWKAFWREVISQGGNPEDYYPILAETQPEFDEAKTIEQLKHIRDADKKPTTVLYNKLFHPWDEIVVDGAEKEDWIAEYGEELLASEEAFGYEEDKNRMFYWDGTVYVLNTYTVRGMVRNYLKARSKAVYDRKIRELVSYIQDYNNHSVWDFNTDKETLVLENGFYNLETLELLPATSDYLCTIKYPVEYIPKKEIPPIFQQYLTNINEEPEEQERMCQIMRDIITNKMIDKKSFLVLHGVTNAGKGMMARVLMNIIGLKNVAILSVHEFSNKFTTGELLHKKIAADTDCASESLTPKDLGLLKKLTGLDPMGYQKKFQDPVYGVNIASFLMCCNKVPELPSGDESNSIMNRAIFIKFTNTYPIDNEFEKNLMAEIDQIFSYLIDLKPKDYKAQISGYSNEEYWLRESDPIYSICMDNMKYANDPEYVIVANDVVNDIYEKLHDMGFGLTQDNILRGKMYAFARKIGGQKFIKQMKNTRIIFLKNIVWEGIDGESIIQIEGNEMSDTEKANRAEKASRGEIDDYF